MTIDGTFTWVFGWPSDPKMTRDTLKTMELGWLIKTDDSEYSTEKVNYKYYIVQQCQVQVMYSKVESSKSTVESNTSTEPCD